MTIPPAMRQVNVAQPGGPEVMQVGQAPVPQPGPGEVLVRAAAAGVNRPDVAQRRGLYPPPGDASPVRCARPRSRAEKGAIADELRANVWPKLDAGQCAPVIHGVFPLERVADAHALMETSTHVGKIVLTLAP